MTIQEWYKQYIQLTGLDRMLINQHVETLNYKPKFTLLTPVYNTKEKWLRLCFDSVLSQIYQNWELCICDNGSNPETSSILKEYADKDSRIKVVRLEVNAGGFGGTNAAIDIATGDYLGFLDSDDELIDQSLYLFAELINRHKDATLIYSDEAIVDTNSECVVPFFKPDFSPHLLMSQNCVSHLSFWKADLLKQLKMKDSAGSHDYDLTLRTMEVVDWNTIYHLQALAYKYRSHPQSLAANTESYCIMGAVKALREHLERINRKATVYYDWPWYRVKYALNNPPHVDILVASINKGDILKPFIEDILAKTDYPDYTIYLTIPDDVIPVVTKWYGALITTGKIKLVKRDDSKGFNYSVLANSLVKSCDGPVICILNDDVEPLNYNWLEEMVSYTQHPETGIVGARLLYSNMTYQHVGCVLGLYTTAAHVFKGHNNHSHGYFGRGKLVGNWSMVTGACWVMRKEIYDQIGGYDEGFKVAYGDVDVCIKAMNLGLYNVCTPYASLLHKESFTRGLDTTPEQQATLKIEEDLLRTKWGRLLNNDPFYNPNLSLRSINFDIADLSESRYQKPWLA